MGRDLQVPGWGLQVVAGSRVVGQFGLATWSYHQYLHHTLPGKRYGEGKVQRVVAL